LGVENAWLAPRSCPDRNYSALQTPPNSKPPTPNFSKLAKIKTKVTKKNPPMMDVMEFFQHSAGRWKSKRITHHLAFRRSEMGESEIEVKALAATDATIIELCESHQVDPNLAVGGCCVTWAASMGWDQEGENHEGKTVFALVPDPDKPYSGQLLRDRGYAEIVSVIGHYQMDNDGGLVLTTEYDIMSSIERFWFPSDNVRVRSSTVKRMGGFSTATFCTETRWLGTATADTVVSEPATAATAPNSNLILSPLGW
jgi:CpeS-like protein